MKAKYFPVAELTHAAFIQNASLGCLRNYVIPLSISGNMLHRCILLPISCYRNWNRCHNYLLPLKFKPPLWLPMLYKQELKRFFSLLPYFRIFKLGTTLFFQIIERLFKLSTRKINSHQLLNENWIQLFTSSSKRHETLRWLISTSPEIIIRRLTN